MKNKVYVKGLVMGFVIGIAVPLILLCTAVFFNIGNIGNLVQTTKVLNSKSLHTLSLTEKTTGAINGMVDALDDPYSYYLDAEDYADLLDEVSGAYEGLGIYLTNEDGNEYTTIMSPIKGSPAFDAGIKAGDEIVSLNGKNMSGKKADEIANTIKKGDETHFVLEVRRDGETLSFEIDRTLVNIPSVDGKFLEGENGIAYISISNFANNTPTEMTDTIAALEKEGTINGIILDLRNNPGGSVSAVLQIADMFLREGQHVLWVEEKSGEKNYDAVNTNPYAYSMVVLVNENSASASEILSGAIKENKRATIIGTTTFGKGIIQTVFSLSDGAAVKVTTAEYLSPDKNKIHGIGVVPDIEEALNGDDISVIYDVDPTTDNQLTKALSTLKLQIKE